MQLESDSVLLGVLAFIGTTLVTMLGVLWRKVTGMETRSALLEQQQAHQEVARAEDRAEREVARRTIVERIDLHHAVVVEKVDSLSGRVDRLEKTVRNGH